MNEKERKTRPVVGDLIFSNQNTEDQVAKDIFGEREAPHITVLPPESASCPPQTAPTPLASEVNRGTPPPLSYMAYPVNINPEGARPTAWYLPIT